MLELQVRIDVPPAGIGIDVTLRLHDEPPVAVAESVTVLENPPRDATVIVEVPPVGPRGAVTLVGLALKLIPPGLATTTEIWAVWFVIRLLVPPTPVILTKYVFGVLEEKAQVVVMVPPAAKTTDPGLHEIIKPVEGVTVEPIVTAPANCWAAAPRLVSVTRTPPLPPGLNETLVELDAMV